MKITVIGRGKEVPGIFVPLLVDGPQDQNNNTISRTSDIVLGTEAQREMIEPQDRRDLSEEEALLEPRTKNMASFGRIVQTGNRVKAKVNVTGVDLMTTG